MRLTILLVLGACNYAPSVGAGDGPLATDAADAAGDAPPDMMIDDDDDDDDNVLDVDDNCPVLANDQHDEDADGRGDACDPCPMFASGDTTDTDLDGVADACDPHPNTAGDVLVRFEGFGTAGGLPAGWEQIGGAAGDWVVTGDELTIASSTTPHSIRTDAEGPHATVHVVFTHSMPGGGIPAAAAIVDGDATLANELACSILTQISSNNLLAVKCANGTCGTFGGSASGQATNPIRIVATAESTLLNCAFSRGGSTSAFGSPGVTPTRNGVGIGVQSLRLAIPFIAVYRAP